MRPPCSTSVEADESNIRQLSLYCGQRENKYVFLSKEILAAIQWAQLHFVGSYFRVRAIGAVCACRASDRIAWNGNDEIGYLQNSASDFLPELAFF
jgi:hypothetical protein